MNDNHTVDDEDDAEPETVEPTDQEFRAAADLLHGSEGECEIDEGAEISRGDDPGAYVQAWVWVSFADVESARKNPMWDKTMEQMK